jgi:hypothetical protein
VSRRDLRVLSNANALPVRHAASVGDQPNHPITPFDQFEAPGMRFPGLFSVGAMHMSREWWAVLIAALAAALVKLGVVAGVPW